MAVYIWGLGKNGQLGTGKANTEHTPQRATKTFTGQKLRHVKQVSCGALFTALLTEEGCVYTTGCGKYGRLGIRQKEEDLCLFSPVNIEGVTSQVSCGSWHAVAITDKGQINIWGYKKACGDALSQDQEDSKNASFLGIPHTVTFTEDVKIAGVSCGHNYTFAWTFDGQLFSWGRGQDGVLGHGEEKDVSNPKRVRSLADKEVVNVGAGHSHCGIVTRACLLYMTGKGSDGALGRGQSNLNSSSQPSQVMIDGKVIAVSCSKGEHHGHTLALTDDGKVWAWGDGYKGKLGLGHQESRYTPSQISQDHFDGERVVSVSAGGIHSSAATAQGHVYTWGCGSDGRLGHPEGQGHRYLFRSDVPKRVEGLPKGGEGRAMVSAAYYHTATVLGL